MRLLLTVGAVVLAGYLAGSRWQRPMQQASRERLMAQHALDAVRAEQTAANQAYLKQHEEVFQLQARALDLQNDLRLLREEETKVALAENGMAVDAQVCKHVREVA